MLFSFEQDKFNFEKFEDLNIELVLEQNLDRCLDL